MIPGSTPEHAGLGARRRQLGRRRLGDEAPVAGTVIGVEHRDLALEAEDRPVDDRDPLEQRGVVDQVAGREVVRPVDDGVVAVDDVEDVVRAQAHVVGDDVHVGVQRGQRLLGRVDLALAHPVHVVEDLALQVGLVDDVHVDDAERAHAGGGQVEGGRRPQAPGTEEQHLGVEQLELARLAHLGQEQVALVAVALGRGEGLRRLPGRPSSFHLLKPPISDCTSA